MGAVAILVPAAGASSRMRGTDKLLEMVRGQPLLRDRVTLALGTGCDVAVTLPPEGLARRTALKGLDATLLPVPDAATGMSASLRAGATWAMAEGVTALMVLLPDLPDLTADDMKIMLQVNDYEHIFRACDADGTPGHPVILPARLLPDLAQITGDTGARDLLRAHPVTPVPLPRQHATTDLDTPEAWAAWRAAQG
ncbi:Molybdopterin-guanine dinucleotide biosynthesis protein MobA [Roseovarius sp. EC-HK134]|uniref:nucleotidyltransferase family protein n=1 Tax=unclassified Roseovarius TaxID=2614913 RepID=UPI00125695C1|nr:MULTISPECIES: nucleotidyltransferase family protein [unclassified Roseovarius]VVT29443.1 Molybdopterin-guanine dinucleotide biosynthesis protein MobA [Roseovarius sp. EC-HK134]VVT30660.1 Molybdopterin-guanine dinucleotide biosynthesis protein MobA [Roseovarius sp. EC-SD190]